MPTILMTIEQLRLAEKICDLLQAQKASEIDGEKACLWTAGLSMGVRQQPIAADEPMRILATAWSYGAEQGGL